VCEYEYVIVLVVHLSVHNLQAHFEASRYELKRQDGGKRLKFGAVSVHLVHSDSKSTTFLDW